jgi:spermidine/putrescine transport system ATP-binding protein
MIIADDAATDPHLQIAGIRKAYGTTVALSQVDLNVARGKYVVLLGPSGSGKTTLLSIIGGFTVPSAGSIWIGGKDVTDLPPVKRPTATVFQDYALFPHMTVAGNVGFALTMRGVNKAKRKLRVGDALDLVGLSGFGARRIDALSGGQKQRVALARALLVDPEVLLLDEPLGALDLHLRRQVQEELRGLQRSTGRSFVHVTHDQEEAMALADLIVIVNQGAIEDFGPPRRLYERPATRFAATFMGESTLIPGTVRSLSGGAVTVETPLGQVKTGGMAAQGAEVMLAVRPENWIAGTAPGAQSLGIARVTEAGYQGSYLRVRAESETEVPVPILMRLPTSQIVARGETVALACRPEHLVLLTR